MMVLTRQSLFLLIWPRFLNRRLTSWVSNQLSLSMSLECRNSNILFNSPFSISSPWTRCIVWHLRRTLDRSLQISWIKVMQFILQMLPGDTTCGHWIGSRHLLLKLGCKMSMVQTPKPRLRSKYLTYLNFFNSTDLPSIQKSTSTIRT